MSFDVSADAYARFMGRYSEPLAHQFVDLVGVSTGLRALDVGCGPGALTGVLVDRLGASQVYAIDPSPPFVAAMSTTFPGVDVQAGAAEALPYADSSFDVTCAQLVVHFMSDPVVGLGEMRRVTKPGGAVSASVWDHAGGSGPLTVFWQAVRDVDPISADESGLPGVREGHLEELFRAAGMASPTRTKLAVEVEFRSFDDWWEPYLLGVGPAGAYVAKLDDSTREQVRARCQDLLPAAAPFTLRASAWCVVATV